MMSDQVIRIGLSMFLFLSFLPMASAGVCNSIAWQQTFDDANVSGTTALDTFGKYNGKIIGTAVTGYKGLNGQAFLFNANNEAVKMGYKERWVNLTTAFDWTICTVMNYTGDNSDLGLLHKLTPTWYGFQLNGKDYAGADNFYFEFYGTSNCGAHGATALDTSKWHMFCVGYEYDGDSDWTDISLWSDNISETEVQVGNADCSDLPNSVDNFTIGTGNGETNYWKSYVDYVAVFNKTLTDAEVAELYHKMFLDNEVCGGGSPPPVITATLTGYFSNLTNPNNKKTVFGEGERFFTYANFTMSNGSIVTDAQCNATFYNASIETDAADEDFSLCGTGCMYSYYSQKFNISKTNADYDAVHFNACHSGTLLIGDITVSLCGTSYTVPAANLPACPAQNFVFVTSTACKTKGWVNYSLSYTGNNNRKKNVSSLGLDRFYTSLEKPMIYNASKTIYKSNISVEYYIHGNKNILVECNQTSYNKATTLTATIVNVPPVITMEKIVTPDANYSMVSGVKVEYSFGNWTFKTSVADDDLYRVRYVFRNSSQIIHSVTASTPYFPSVNSTKFLKTGNYNLSVYANDTFGNKSFKSIKFIVNDTSAPSCVGLENQFLNSYLYNWSVLCGDEYFYSFNISCDNGFSFYEENIALQTYTFEEHTIIPPSTAFIECGYEYCDGHTKKDIKSMVVKSYLQNKTLVFDKKKLVFKQPVKSFKWAKKNDRYTFCIKPESNITTYDVLIPDGCYIAEDSPYPGHLVCPDARMWFDFVNPLVTVTTGDTITLDISNTKGEVCFNSVGKFNCVEGTQFLIYDTNAGTTEELDSSNIQDTMIIIAILAFVCFMLVFSEMKGEEMMFRWLTFFFMFVVMFVFFEVYVRFALAWLVFTVMYLIRIIYMIIE